MVETAAAAALHAAHAANTPRAQKIADAIGQAAAFTDEDMDAELADTTLRENGVAMTVGGPALTDAARGD